MDYRFGTRFRLDINQRAVTSNGSVIASKSLDCGQESVILLDELVLTGYYIFTIYVKWKNMGALYIISSSHKTSK